MPSPHESARPVAGRETLPSNPLISFLRISLISDGLISAIFVVDTLSLACQPLPGLIEASCEAAVVNFSAQFRRHAAEKGRIDFHGWNYFLGGDSFDTADHARDFCVGWLKSKGKRRAFAAHPLVQQIAIPLP